MIPTEELRAFADLLHNRLSLSALPPDRQHELMLLGILAELEELAATTAADTPPTPHQSNDPDAAESDPLRLLQMAAAGHASHAVRNQALRALLRLSGEGKPAAIDALYRLAIEQETLAARQAILTHPWQTDNDRLAALFEWGTVLNDRKPYPPERLAALTEAYFTEASPALQRRLLANATHNRADNWARIVSAIQNGSSEALQGLVERYPALTAGERQLALDWLARLAARGTRPAQETLAALFIRHEDAQARALALEHGYLPQDSAQRALFLFLAEAWQPYQSLDFDHSLLISAYEAGGRSLRRRLMEHSRHTGQMDWLRANGSAGEVRWIDDLADADWELVIRRLSEEHKLADLWRLAQAAPPLWSAAILERLGQSTWVPTTQDEQEGFATLLRLAHASLASPLVIKPMKGLANPGAEITALALSPDGHELAAGCAAQPVYRWELPDGDPRPALNGPAPVTRALAYSPDGEFLVSAASDQRIRIFKLQSGQIVKTLVGHSAMIRGLLIHPDGRTLYSAGFDGTLRFWRFPYGPELSVLRPGAGEIFGLVQSSGGQGSGEPSSPETQAGRGQYLVSAGADKQVRVWSLPEGIQARALTGHTDTITHLAGQPNSELVASAGREGLIYVWNVASGGLVCTIQTRAGNEPDPAGPISALCLHPNEQVLLGGRTSGEITLWNLSTGRVIGRLPGRGQPVSGLVLSPTGERLYSATVGAADPVQVWDLGAFLAIRLAGQWTRPGALNELQTRSQQPHLSPSEKNWLTFTAELAHWRQRFDIEISEFDTIQVDEFDIELS